MTEKDDEKMKNDFANFIGWYNGKIESLIVWWQQYMFPFLKNLKEEKYYQEIIVCCPNFPTVIVDIIREYYICDYSMDYSLDNQRNDEEKKEKENSYSFDFHFNFSEKVSEKTFDETFGKVLKKNLERGNMILKLIKMLENLFNGLFKHFPNFFDLKLVKMLENLLNGLFEYFPNFFLLLGELEIDISSLVPDEGVDDNIANVIEKLRNIFWKIVDKNVLQSLLKDKFVSDEIKTVFDITIRALKNDYMRSQINEKLIDDVIKKFDPQTLSTKQGKDELADFCIQVRNEVVDYIDNPTKFLQLLRL
jgi:hypothetical protein